MSTRVTIDPVTRIEGHLRIDLEVDGGRVKNAWSSGTMWRGIETILKGRDPREAWIFAQRICGVCTTVHAMASVRSVENALGLEIPVNAHGGTGSPDYGKYAVTPMLLISEVSFYSQRPLAHLILSGVFARFPKLKFVVTEAGAAWIPGLVRDLDRVMAQVRAGAIGAIEFFGQAKMLQHCVALFKKARR